MTGPKIKPLSEPLQPIASLARRTKEPLPVTVRQWRRRVAACFRAINFDSSHVNRMGREWLDNRRRYQLDLLFDCCNHPPQSLVDSYELDNVRQRTWSCLRYYRT